MAESSSQSLQAILFDFDGTLIDASDVICHSCNHALALVGLPPRSSDELRARIGIPLRDVFAELAPAFPVDQMLAAYREEFWKHSHSGTRLLSGVGELLPLLGRRFRLAIVTSRSSRGAWEMLEHFSLRSVFEVVVGVDHVVNPKPHPEPVLSALAQLEVEAAQAWFVGDTPQDMAAAVAAGVVPVGIATGVHSGEQLLEAGAVMVLREFSELAQLAGIE